MGKHTRLPFRVSESHSFFPFQLVHSDVWTSPCYSYSGYKYYVIFLDDYTHYLWSIPLRNKSDVFPTVRAFISYVHTQFHLPILAFQTDNGGEYDSTAMRLLLSSLGTQLRLSCPYTSQQHGKAERILRTVNDCLRTLLIHSAAPLALWAEALATATYLINRRPCRATRSTTPHELLFGVAPSYTELRVFGCRCFPNTTAVSPHKLAARSTPCVFIGYPADHRGYRCFNITIGRVITSRHVVFDEGVFPFCDTSNSTLQQATRASSSSAVSCDTDSDIAPRTGPSTPSPPRLLDALLQHPTRARTARPGRTPVAGSSNPSAAAPLAPAAPSATPSSPTNHPTHPMVTRARAGISKPNPKYAFVTKKTR